ncbi:MULTISPECIES: LysM peptidoglycan-binding domain-containing protein [unclassified Salinibacterium]|uniref:LysM peptidoglycan-binding domain-containing protein n=1 Tax=Salinibacterium sp. GXW1014 TaxID=3377838 RepID=UPI001A0E9BA0|nr:LysM peptidoglycan-binding domain-containing protein [Salinibacterium sp.]MBF0671399.1 LysM peptidoglycan-binding domain-containing protein [Salinibacterium sp.]
MSTTASPTREYPRLRPVESIAARPRLRLTRRGRVVFTTLAATPLVIAALLLGLNGGMATASGTAGAPLEAVTVSSGQSLWSIASEVAPDADPRDVIASFVQVNQLDSLDVVPGQELLVPARY